ncbi:MAG: hypothetical protein ACT4OU_07595 [Hyphomicrobium sp.]
MISQQRAAAILAALSMSSLCAFENRAASPVDPLAHLAGRWIGQAVMTPVSGPQSNFSCVVTYLPRQDAPGMQQNLRCDNGENFKLHAATELVVEGEKVTGRWKDKINEIDGSLTGSVTSDGFDVQLTGRYFEARMAVAGQGCDQSVRVLPAKSDVFRELMATLKKC